MRKQYRAEQRQICRRIRAIAREQQGDARHFAKVVKQLEREALKYRRGRTQELKKLRIRLAVLHGRLS